MAIGFNVLLSLVNVIEIATFGQYGRPGPALLAALVTVPLHIRHVVYGLRGVRPPAGAWTLAALAIVNFIAGHAVGVGWLYGFASLAVSILIVVRGPWAPVLAGLVILSPLLLTRWDWYLGETAAALTGSYLATAIAWRTIAQIVPVRLVSALRQAMAARQELESRAVIQDRLRIDAELRSGLGTALKEIVAQGEATLGALPSEPDRATGQLHALLGASRRTLSDARRIVATYRSASAGAELAAATTLLEAADQDSQAAVRAALARAFRHPESKYRLENP